MGNGGDDEMSEAHHFEEITRNREHDEMLLLEDEKVVFAKEDSSVFSGDNHLAAGDAKAAEAGNPGTGAGLAPPSEGTGPVDTSGNQCVLNMNLAMPILDGYDPQHYLVSLNPLKPPKDEMQGSCALLVSSPPAKLQWSQPPFPASVMPDPPSLISYR